MISPETRDLDHPRGLKYQTSITCILRCILLAFDGLDATVPKPLELHHSWTPRMLIVLQAFGSLSPRRPVTGIINQMGCVLPSIGTILSIWSRPKWCGRSGVTPSVCLTTITIRCSIARILPLPIHIHIRATRRIVHTAVDTIRLSIAIRQISNNCSKLLLQNFNSLLDNRVWLKISGTLDFEVEPLGDCVVVERLALLGRLFPLSVLTLWPFEC